MILSLGKSFHLVDQELKKLDLQGEPLSLYEPIRYILNLGGKRLRPILTLYAHHIFSDDIKQVLRPALAVEVFHNFTLMHDDIMDKAPLRRGHATVHERWDNNVAILSGDAMLVKAYELFAGLNADIYKKVIERFNKTALEVCEGQMLDMNYEALEEVTEAEYLRMIELKTSVLLGFSLELGALIAGVDDKLAAKLFKVGVDAGIGFQIKDDLLDLYGASDKVGKQVGGDIIANKKTYLLVKFMEVASKDDRKQANAWLKKKDFDKQEKVAFFKAMFDKYDIADAAEVLINTSFDRAMLQLEGYKADLLRKGKLKRLLINLIQREN
ncbi:MAG TPA: polyprenyl synthetase family protein [Cytophagales bacterium]|nr:polyprenyl synthetase family protein [Cytophagales bacterium]